VLIHIDLATQLTCRTCTSHSLKRGVQEPKIEPPSQWLVLSTNWSPSRHAFRHFRRGRRCHRVRRTLTELRDLVEDQLFFVKCTHLYKTGQNGKGDHLIVWRHFLKSHINTKIYHGIPVFYRLQLLYHIFIFCNMCTYANFASKSVQLVHPRKLKQKTKGFKQYSNHHERITIPCKCSQPVS